MELTLRLVCKCGSGSGGRGRAGGWTSLGLNDLNFRFLGRVKRGYGQWCRR